MTLHVLWPAVRWADNLHIETEALGPGVTPIFSLDVKQVTDEMWAKAGGIVGGPDLPDEIIAKMPPWLRHRLMLTPHSAFYTPESARDMRSIAARTAARYLRDGRLENCVNEAFLASNR
ncbi:MAG: hypothetical protein KA169_07555 [Burkholderiaceae bacterium]|jgi:hypothetical protein|nr:hypothetical protein [Burkholderiaceae bacterium]